jgi:type I restriction enzyme M protein
MQLPSSSAFSRASTSGFLRGGIPRRDIDDLESYWQIFPSVRATLLKRDDRPGYIQLKVAGGDIKAAIFGHVFANPHKQNRSKGIELV